MPDEYATPADAARADDAVPLPSTIRADRLLLALDIIGELGSVNHRRGFDPARLLDAVSRIGFGDRRFFAQKHSGHPTDARTLHALRTLQMFLAENIETLGATPLRIETVVAQVALIPKARFREFLAAVDDGAITDADCIGAARTNGNAIRHSFGASPP